MYSMVTSVVARDGMFSGRENTLAGWLLAATITVQHSREESQSVWFGLRLMQVVGMSFLYRDYGSASSFLVVKMFVRRPETFSLHHSLGWLLLPLLAGLWHGSNVGSDRPNVRSRLFGERLTEYYPSTQYSVTKNIRWHSSSQCTAMFKIIRISLDIGELSGDNFGRGRRSSIKHLAISNVGEHKPRAGIIIIIYW